MPNTQNSRGIRARASTLAALAPTSKPGRNLQKPVAKISLIFRAKICHAFLACSRQQYGIPTQNQKIYQKTVVKISIIFRARNCHAKFEKNPEIWMKNHTSHIPISGAQKSREAHSEAAFGVKRRARCTFQADLEYRIAI